MKVWVCDYPDCGHRWWKYKKKAPKYCAKCKKPNWDKLDRPLMAEDEVPEEYIAPSTLANPILVLQSQPDARINVVQVNG